VNTVTVNFTTVGLPLRDKWPKCLTEKTDWRHQRLEGKNCRTTVHKWCRDYWLQ